MRTIALLLLCFAFTSLAAQEETPTTPQIAIKINLGETIVTRGMNIQFMEVLEDSRCPEGVVCVWAGQARVKVKISGPEVKEQEVELKLSITKPEDVIFTGEDFVLRALVLTPYPTIENRGKREYALLMVDEKLRN